jgi:predicted DCC family thiol-disulfide oxidoreductase YuxK
MRVHLFYNRFIESLFLALFAPLVKPFQFSPHRDKIKKRLCEVGYSMDKKLNDKMPNAIILFDGVCNFCDSSVQFIIKRDPESYFTFASMQGNKGQEILSQHHLTGYLGSLVLIENGKLYLKSTAALRICKNLKGLWKLCYLFIAVPAPLRSFIYNYIANHRYKWFGKKESCTLPSPEIRNRFWD